MSRTITIVDDPADSSHSPEECAERQYLQLQIMQVARNTKIERMSSEQGLRMILGLAMTETADLRKVARKLGIHVPAASTYQQ